MQNIFFTCWRAVLEVLFPSCCAACGHKLIQEEREICSSCLVAIPRTEHAAISDNGIDMLFAERIHLEHRKIRYERGAAFAYYNRDRGQVLRQLIERGKFGTNPNPEVFYVLGREAAREYVGSALLEDIDMLVPIPLHSRRLRERGFKEVTLLGQNVNSYNYTGSDGVTVDFAALLAMVAEAAPDMRVRFTTSHPKDMSDEIIATMARYPNICKHIHLPVQSGSNAVLKSMNRKYTREWYLDRIAAIRRAMPDCGISTDLFTGFHDESEADFEMTLDLMREVGFDSSFMFKYSERPGTLASKVMPDNVPEDVKIDRLNRMIALQNELSAASNRRDVGRTFDVLVEGVSKRSKEQMVGRNQQNKTCVFPRGTFRIGDTVKVKVVDSSSATLICELA